MGNLPGSRNRTYIDGLTNIPAGDMNDIQDAIINLSGSGSYGDGSDGAAVLDGVNTYPWASNVGNIYTLIRDVNLTTLTVPTGSTLYVGDGSGTYRIFATTAITVQGTGQITAVSRDGLPGNVGGAAGPGMGSGGTVGGSGAGGAGHTGAGSAGTATTSARGGAGGAGGHGPATASGAAGTATAAAAGRGSSHQSFGQMMGHAMGINAGVSTPVAFTGGGGGGGGGGDNASNAGGGGGGGGPVFMLSARVIILAFATSLMAAGGKGGDAIVNNTGGGAGGGGGYMRVVTMSLSVASGTMSAAVNCPGGAAGASGSGGTAAAAGATGALELVIAV